MFYDFTKSFDENIKMRDLAKEMYFVSRDDKRKQNTELFAKEVRRLTEFLFNNIIHIKSFTILTSIDFDTGLYGDGHLEIHFKKDDICSFEKFKLCDESDIFNISRNFSYGKDEYGHRCLTYKLEK